MIYLAWLLSAVAVIGLIAVFHGIATPFPHIPDMTEDEEIEYLRGEGLTEDQIKEIVNYGR